MCGKGYGRACGNFIPYLRDAFVDPRQRPKGEDVRIMGFEISENILTGYISQ